MAVKYYIPGVGYGLFDDGTSLADALRIAGKPEAAAILDNQSPQDNTPSTLGALGRGVVRGILPSAAALAAAAPAAAIGTAVGGAIGGPFAPVTAPLGGLVGGIGAAYFGSTKTADAQQQFFQDHPNIADAVGQSTEQQQADIQSHPYAAAIGEALPNFVAFRPSLSALSRIAEDTSAADAAAIRSARINAGIGATIGAGQDLANQAYTNPGNIDWKEVALQGALGSLAQKETRVGRALSIGRNIVPESLRSQAIRTTVDERTDAGRPTDLLDDTNNKIPTEQLALPAPDDISGPQITDNTPPLNVSATGAVGRLGDVAFEDRQPLAGAAFAADQNAQAVPDARRVDFMAQPEGTQGDAFAYNGGDRVSPTEPFNPAEAPGPEPAANTAPAAIAADTQPTLFDKAPQAEARSSFGPKEILQRLQQSLGPDAVKLKPETATTTALDTASPRDPFVYKTFSEINRNLAHDNVPALEGWIIDQRQQLESASIKPATIEVRSRVLDAAQSIADDYKKATAEPVAPKPRRGRPPKAQSSPPREAAPKVSEPAEVTPVPTHEEISGEPVRGRKPAEKAPQSPKVQEVKEKAAAKRDSPKPRLTETPERAQEAPEQVKEPKKAQSSPPREEVVSKEPEGLDHAQALGKLSADIDKALKNREITASDRLKLRQLVKNGAMPEMVETALEDAKGINAGRAFEDAMAPKELRKEASRVPVAEAASVQRVIEAARRHETAKAVVEELGKQRGFYGETARRMAKSMPEIPVKVITDNHMRLEERANGTPLGADEHTAGFYDPIDHRIVLNDKFGDERTMLHEVAHAMTSAHILQRTPIGLELEGLYKKFLNRSRVRDGVEPLDYGFTNAREFVAEIWGNPQFRAKIEGLTAPLWKRVLNVFRRALGLKTTSDVERIMELSEKAAPTAVSILKRAGGARLAPEPLRVKENIEKLPDPLQNAAYAITDTFRGVGSRVAARVALGPKLYQLADEAGLPSAKVLQRLKDEANSIAERIESSFLGLAKRFDAMPSGLRGRAEGSVNALAKEMVMSGGWAFEPKWLRDQADAPVKVEVDPALAAKYNALPGVARQALEDMFRETHDTLHKSWDAVRAFVEGEHTALIAAAQDELDQAKQAGAPQAELTKLQQAVDTAEANRSSDMARFHKLFSVDLTSPYAPIRRFGNYVVVGRSPELRAAEEDYRATGHVKTLDTLKSDPEHYYVDFAESRAEAERMRRQLAPSFDKDIEVFTKDKAGQRLFGDRDMFYAFQRLRNMIDTSDGSGTYKSRLNSLVTDMMLSTLAETSARKAEMRRLKVAGGDFDMMRATLQHGKSNAQFIAALHKSDQVLDSLRKLGVEAKGDGSDPLGREKRETYHQELLARHVSDMSPTPQNALANKVSAFTGTWLISSAPAFYVQQLTQPAMLSIPEAGARHGYARAWRELMTGYKAVGDSWKGTGLLDPLKIEQLPEDLRAFGHFMAERGRLNVGIFKDIADWTSDGNGPMTDATRNVVSKLRALTQKSEAINRMSSGVMMYKLELAHPSAPIHDEAAYASYLADAREAHPDLTPMTEAEFAAANHALKLIDDTQGTYDTANAPRFMRGSWQRVIFQFKKFQIMQVQLYAQHLRDFFASDVSPQEKLVAGKALLYLTGHAAVMAGALGLPGVTALMALWNTLNGAFGDKNKRPDAERDAREAIGDPGLANLLLNGAPTLAGLNLTGSLGEGNILSFAPYADMPTDKKSYDAFVTALMGPAIGGIGQNVADAYSLFENGQTYQALEKLTPRGLASAMKAVREASSGERNKFGDVTASDIPTTETLAGLMGLTSTTKSGRQFARSQDYQNTEFNKGRSHELQSAYVDAFEAGDNAAMAKIRAEWLKFQAERVAQGYDRQPMSALTRAPLAKRKRERQTVGGLQYSKSTKGYAQALNDLTDETQD